MPTIRPISGWTMEVVEDYSFVCCQDSKMYTIPKGFEFDGASIPRVFWSILGSPFAPKHIKASLQHDYLISIDVDGSLRDLQFYCVLIKSGVKPWKAKIMYLAVVFWRKAKKLFD